MGLNTHLHDDQDGASAGERLAGRHVRKRVALESPGNHTSISSSPERLLNGLLKVNSPSWCYEESVYKVWELLGSGVQGNVEWHLLLVLPPAPLRQTLQSMAGSHAPREAATPFTTSIRNPEYPQEPCLARLSSRH